MHSKHLKTNIPIEQLRTFVACVDHGSFTKAAETLNITQSAVSAQIKKLSGILGGDVFAKTKSGFRLTKRGEDLQTEARKLLVLNDRILALVGPNPTEPHYRVGMPRYLGSRMLRQIIDACSATGMNLEYLCENLEDLTTGLSGGYIDFAFVCNQSQPPGITFAEWSEQQYWIKSPKLVLTEGERVPLVGWSGTLHRIATKALDDAGIRYFMAFKSPELATRLGAVEAGLGIMMVSGRSVTADVEIVKSNWLPPAPRIPSGIYMRDGLNEKKIAPLLRAFRAAVRPQDAPDTPLPRPARNGRGKPPKRR